ncbi:MAG: SMI1/KNR4 family protein [Phycisphaerae bacterium]|nr:SMI1/KNR4 family protein [Phycisphaerae bacterium]
MGEFNPESFKRLFTQLGWSPHGASEDVITAAEADTGVRFPSDYRSFFRWATWAAGWLGEEAYISLYPVEELAESTINLRLHELLPGVAIIGTSGGGMALGLTWRAGRPLFVWLPFDCMIDRQVRVLGHTLMESLQALAHDSGWQVDLTL